MKREVAEGVDLMVVRELTGGLWGSDSGFNTVDFFLFYFFPDCFLNNHEVSIVPIIFKY